MARRRRKGRRHYARAAIPLAQTAVIAIPIWRAWKQYGTNVGSLADGALYNLSGYSLNTSKWISPVTGVTNAVVLLALGTIGKKIANRTGANRLAKKMTAGMATLM